MRFEEVLGHVRELPYFTPAMLGAFGWIGPAVEVALSRWVRDGKLTRLRRGLYRAAPPFDLPLPAAGPAALAHELREPSYLSLEWALNYHGLIPDVPFTFTSVTRRTPWTCSNAVGRYSYRNLTADLWWGFEEALLGQWRWILARPEKAMLDYWHLGDGEWTLERQLECRWQGLEEFDRAALAAAVARADRPRLHRAHETFLAAAEQLAW